MLIGTKYADNKLYRGIKHYDHLPLPSSDIHEYADTVYMKTAYIMNNIIGHGVLNSPKVSISTTGISLTEPAVVLIDGDVSLVQSDEGTPLISKSLIGSAGYSSGVVCIVGWYQFLNYQSTLRSYGGVQNSILENDLLHPELNIQVSTRYQFRWVPIVVNSTDITSNSITFNLANRDETGELTSGSHTITSIGKVGNIYTAPVPTSMSYATSDLHIIPILKYEYDSTSGSITDASSYLPITPKGSSGFINSETEPTGEYVDGTTWYNPITREFKTYINGVGFVSSTSKMGFLQYQSVYSMPDTIGEPQNISVPVNINELEEGDILQVTYEGLVLSLNEHYTIDYNNHTITLLDFTTESGDRVTFTSTKIVEANDITNITTTFTQHMASTGSSTIEAHVKLSDSVDDRLDANSGVAATPKAVSEAKFINDASNNKKYRFGVENGLLYLEEV